MCLFILRPNYPWSPAPPTIITINSKPSTCLLATLPLQALFNVLAQRAAWVGEAARMSHAKPADVTFGQGPGQWPGTKGLLAHSSVVFALQARFNAGAEERKSSGP